jgi:hypothetical protein
MANEIKQNLKATIPAMFQREKNHRAIGFDS